MSWLYIIWLLIPGFFFLLALWAKLEKMGKSSQKQNPADFFRQGTFLLICVVISIIIDALFLDAIVGMLDFMSFPKGVFQFLLLPVVCVLLAMVIGPSKEIRIGKAPRPSERKRR